VIVEGGWVDHWICYMDVRVSVVVFTVERESALGIFRVLRIRNIHFKFRWRFKLRLALRSWESQ
jgi:hypothetical protein